MEARGTWRENGIAIVRYISDSWKAFVSSASMRIRIPAAGAGMSRAWRDLDVVTQSAIYEFSWIKDRMSARRCVVACERTLLHDRGIRLAYAEYYDAYASWCRAPAGSAADRKGAVVLDQVTHRLATLVCTRFEGDVRRIGARETERIRVLGCPACEAEAKVKSST